MSILRLAQVRAITGLGKSTIYLKLAPGKYHDEKFPRPVKLGARSVGWVADEVFAWVAACPSA